MVNDALIERSKSAAISLMAPAKSLRVVAVPRSTNANQAATPRKCALAAATATGTGGPARRADMVRPA